MNTQHSFVRRGLLVAGVTLLLAVLALARPAARADELPRYKLKVGQELVYRTAPAGAEEKTDSPAAMRAECELTLLVVGQNDDGSWRILFRDRTSFGLNYDRKSAGWLDLAPNGRLTEDSTITMMSNPFGVLPPLPENATELAGGWSRATTADETRRDYRASAPASGDVWKFEQDEHSPFELIYLVKIHGDCEFDLAKGCVTRITTTSSQGWPEHIGERGKTKGVFELAETRTLDAGQAAAIKDELTRYFALRAECESITAGDDLRHTAEVYAKALDKCQAAKDQFQQPIVRELYESQLDSLEKSKAYALESAERFAKFLDKPSADWQTTDLDDHPRTLADYRGKVVLLDFWYRGCGWCIRSMPQLKQLVDELPSDKFVILGMNNDRELADARYVIEKMALNYDTLKNGGFEEGIHAKYGVQGWPTLVVLDGAGVVRHIHIGYSPRLREELGSKVRELLAEQGK